MSMAAYEASFFAKMLRNCHTNLCSVKLCLKNYISEQTAFQGVPSLMRAVLAVASVAILRAINSFDGKVYVLHAVMTFMNIAADPAMVAVHVLVVAVIFLYV